MKRSVFFVTIFVSLTLHFILIEKLPAPKGSVENQISTTSRNSQDLSAALKGFETIDQTKALQEIVDEQLAELPEVEIYDSDFISEPKLPTLPNVDTPKENARRKEGSTKNPAPPKNIKANGDTNINEKVVAVPKYTQSQIDAEKAKYASGIRNAIARQIQTPHDISEARIVVSVRMKNGRLSSHKIQQSSGYTEFDFAISKAIKSARYPIPSPAVPSDVTFLLPISIR